MYNKGTKEREVIKCMSKSVIIINEECQGFIGVAKDIKSAFQYLLNYNWITEKTDFLINADDNSEFVHLKHLKERFKCDNLLDILVLMWEDSEQWFEGMFYFYNENIIDYD